MNNVEDVISKSEYDRLLLKTLDGFTITDQEYEKMEKYEDSIKKKSSSSEMGVQRSYSTPAGRAMTIDDDSQNQGFTNALLIISVVTIIGIIAAGLILYT